MYHSMNFDLLRLIFFPRYCLGCEKILRAGVICDACFDAIPRSDPLTLHDALRDAPYFISAATPYEHHAMQAIIRALKFRGIRAAAEPIADLIAEHILPFRSMLHEYTIVPLPLSRERKRTRGFNQAELIAQSLASRLTLPLNSAILTRARHGRPQTDTMSLVERKKNVAGSFTADAARGAIAGKKFLLIDDVTTTGATFLDAARALHAAGAGHIICVAGARAA